MGKHAKDDWEPIGKKDEKPKAGQKPVKLKKIDPQRASSIRVYDNTKKEFEACGIYGDSADTILQRLINFYKKYRDVVKNGRKR